MNSVCVVIMELYDVPEFFIERKYCGGNNLVVMLSNAMVFEINTLIVQMWLLYIGSVYISKEHFLHNSHT